MERHVASMAAWIDLADEVIVVDSRSTDGTLDHVRSRLRHPNVRVIERDRGLYASWNEGIAATSGEWVYVSTAGDTIERDQLLHLLDLGERAQADVVISPPRFVDENGAAIPDLGWPPHEIVAKFGSGEPFVMSRIAAACLAFIHCPSCVLGSSASNVYRGDTLRARPFPTEFRGAGDTVWLMRHSTALRLCLTPRRGSDFCVHPKPDKLTPQEAEAGMIKFIEEKAALAQRISETDPGRHWADLAAETSLYAETRSLHQRRRAAWRRIRSAPGELGHWLKLTTIYAWKRARLSNIRRGILAQLLLRMLGEPAHFQKID